MSLILLQEAGPGGTIGGGTWGAATDEKRVYTNIVNSDAKNFTLVPSNKISTTGGWVAMDASSGKILWSIANPSNNTASGPVTVANEVVFVGSTKMEKFYGPMKLEVVSMVACQLTMRAYLWVMDIMFL